ncbi:alpha/beta hydrolase [Streptomyces sp. NPDC048639]|uniref:alpha/beta hydrolase n=1 Tax=Streptomyces sp. NPDC048639 TaxID=3365581 RepID=UPI00371B650B
MNRFRRAVLAALVTAAVAVPVSGAVRPEVPAPEPAALPASAGPGSRYAANRANARDAARMADAHGDRRRAAHLRTLTDPGRRLLAFDGRGAGRAVEVIGDLRKAAHLAVLVPGSDTTLDTYERFRAGAAALHDRLGRRAAVVTWLGYDTPGTVAPEVLTQGRADDAAPRLTRLVGRLKAYNPRAHVSALCHSYGSVVCARAAGEGLDVGDIVLYGSPGTGASTADDLGTRARVWAGRGGDDWIARVPHVSVGLLGTTVGFGRDPVAPAFGARPFEAGDGGHSDYLAPGSRSLASIGRIVTGDARA